MKHFTDNDFFGAVTRGTVLVNFWAPWCGPCFVFAPTIEFLEDRYTGIITVGKVNIDDNPLVKEHYGVRVIPTTMLFRDGNMLYSHAGYRKKDELLEDIERALV